MKKVDETTKLFGLSIFSKSRNRLLEIVENHLNGQNGLLVVFTPNPEQIMLANKDEGFASNLGFADILAPDGIGLVFASQIRGFLQQKEAVKERITGLDLAEDILKMSKAAKLKVLIIGGRGYAGNENAASGLIKHRGQELQWLEGYRQVDAPKREEEAWVESVIKELRPDVVFVAFGAPHQEKWIIEHRELLKSSGVKLAQAVGGSFDVILGKFKRAPSWMRNLGLEWLFRLVQEPWRAKRQLQLIPFIFLTLKSLISEK